MKAVFIQQDVFKNYGIMIVSAILKKAGHQCEVFVDSLEDDVIQSIQNSNPDIVGFSVPSVRHAWMKNLALKIKANLNVPIMVGGPHPTFFPEIINESYIDIACIGEGEEAILELMNSLRDGKDTTSIKNLWVKKNNEVFKNPIRNLVEDLDTLPFADRSIYVKYSLMREQNMDGFMASRGCPYDCTFCFNAKYNEMYKGKGKVCRRRSVDSMIREIKGVVSSNKKIDYIVFNDDTFILGPQSWFKEFFPRYKREIGLPFSVTARANLVSEDMIKDLKYAGCNSIRMGIESANPVLREKVLKKGITNEQIKFAAEVIKKHGIMLQVYNIIGTPGETLETALETYEFSLRIHPDFAWSSLMQPFPGTEIMDMCKREGLIEENYSFEDLEASYFSTIPLKVPNKKEMMNLQKLFQFGNKLRIPVWFMKGLIKLPPNGLYDLIFKLNYAIGIKKMDKLKWSYVYSVGKHSKEYFKKQKS